MSGLLLNCYTEQTLFSLIHSISTGLKSKYVSDEDQIKATLQSKRMTKKVLIKRILSLTWTFYEAFRLHSVLKLESKRYSLCRRYSVGRESDKSQPNSKLIQEEMVHLS